MPHVSHSRRRQAARQAVLGLFSRPAPQTPPTAPEPIVIPEEADLDRQVCKVLLAAVHPAGGPQTLWHVLDRWPALIPMMVGLLDEEREERLLVDLMHRYFPDESAAQEVPSCG